MVSTNGQAVGFQLLFPLFLINMTVKPESLLQVGIAWKNSRFAMALFFGGQEFAEWITSGPTDPPLSSGRRFRSASLD